MKKVSKDSKTYANLMAAFAGESMARNKYTYYASVAKKEGYEQIAAIFEETANRKKNMPSLSISIDEQGYYREPERCNCRWCYEWSEMYKEFAEIAEEEGYTEVAFTFRKIAEVEYEHEKRYQKLLDNIQNGQVFKRDEVVRWQCRNCGYVHEGKEAPEVCPSCKHPRAHFEIMKSNY